MIIGDAHDQSTLALHQVLHRRYAPLRLSNIIARFDRTIQSRDAHNEASDAQIRDAPLSRGMTTRKFHASNRLKTNVALVPPKPKELDRTVPSLALSIRLRTIGMSAKTGSSSLIC